MGKAEQNPEKPGFIQSIEQFLKSETAIELGLFVSNTTQTKPEDKEIHENGTDQQTDQQTA